MKTSTLKPTLTKQAQLANWLKENPEHPDYATVWKDYNSLKQQQL